MRKVIITGATGFLGKALVKRMLKENVIVYGIDISKERLGEFAAYDNFIPIVAEFKDYKCLEQKIMDSDVDVFYHFAWSGGFTEALKDYSLQLSNANYAVDALVAAKTIGCKKFVHAGTYNEYEIQTFLSAKNFQPRYSCIYSTAKTAADLICRTLAFNIGIEYCIGFIPMPYGEGNYSRQLTNVVIDCLNKKFSPKLVEGNNLYDLVYIDDIVEAFYKIGQKGINQKSYYIGHRELKLFKEWMCDIRDILAPDVELKFGEYKDTQTIDYTLIDLDALYNDTGFECKANFEETIIRTADWVKKLNW